MQFETQFSPVSRKFRAENRKQKFKFRKKTCYDNVVFDWSKYGLICP